MTSGAINTKADSDQLALVGLLDHHFGDGLVYTQSNDDRSLLRKAIARGLVDDNGYLTTRGYRLWQSAKP